MAQHIPLDKSSETTFTKAIKNIKKLMKGKEKSTDLDDVTSDVPKVKSRRSVLGKSPATINPGKHHGKGVVYLRHIPEGFHEKEMNSYFSMFGRVTRLKLVRSPSTGNSKGYAFIEFLYSEVAQVVAETMNNYLMWGRLLKAEYIPGEKVHKNTFSNAWICPENCPRTKLQQKWIEKTNKKLSEEEVSEMAEHELKRLNKLKKQMEEEGILFDCQVDGIMDETDNVMKEAAQTNNEFANGAVLILEDSDDEIEYKIHPNVTVIRPGPSTNKSLSSEEKSPKNSEGGKKGRKRSLSSSSGQSSTPKKRMSLLKSKSDLNAASPAHLNKTAIVELMRVDQSRGKARGLPSPQKIASPKQNPPQDLPPFPKSSSAKKANRRIKKTARMSLPYSMHIAGKKNKTPVVSRIPPETPKRPTADSSSKKAVIPKIKLASSKKSPTPKTEVSSSKKSMTPKINVPSSQLKKTPSVKIRLSSSAKKKQKSSVLIAKRFAFSTSKKNSSIPRLIKQK